MFAVLREELRERVEAARDAYGVARGEGQDRVSAGLAAMRAALEKQRDAPEAAKSVGDRLRRMLAQNDKRQDFREPQGESAKSERGPQGNRSQTSREGDSQSAREVPPRITPNRERDDGWER